VEEMKDLEKAMTHLAERQAEKVKYKRENEWEYTGVLKEWEVEGLLCLVLKGPLSINGYVVVGSGHPFYGTAYSHCPQDCGEDWCNHSPESVIDVHGGLTFRHLGKNGWIFGFDTAHYMDHIPGLASFSEGKKWTIDQVAIEVERMAEQLARVEQKKLTP